MPQTHAVFGELAHCGSEPFDYCLLPPQHTHQTQITRREKPELGRRKQRKREGSARLSLIALCG